MQKNKSYVVQSTLVDQLNRLGLKCGDIVMLHASMRAIGHVLGGPDILHQALVETISNDGTLMMYIGCESEYEILGRRSLPPLLEQSIYDNCPAFNPATARARRDYGILAEFFRSSPNVLCSDNPGARVAAIGGKASWLIENHPLNYGYGPGSPFAKLYESDGKIVLLGSDLDQVTILHYAEHVAPVKDKRIVRCKTPLIQNGQRVWRNVEEFDTSVGIRQWPDRFFAIVMESYFQKYKIRPMTVGSANAYLFGVKSLVDFAVGIFTEEAQNYRC